MHIGVSASQYHKSVSFILLLSFSKCVSFKMFCVSSSVGGLCGGRGRVGEV